MTEVDKMLAQLAPLSRADVQKVYDQCEAILALTRAGAKLNNMSKPDDDDWYARAVGRYAIKKGWWSVRELPIAMANKALDLLPGYKGLSKAMRDRMKKHVGNMEHVQWDALGDVCVKALVIYLRAEHKRKAFEGELVCFRCAKKLPDTRLMLDMYLLMENVGLVFTALDHSLPGYLENNGLLMVVPKVGK